jgi:hypothetical protein
MPLNISLTAMDSLMVQVKSVNVIGIYVKETLPPQELCWISSTVSITFLIKSKGTWVELLRPIFWQNR